MRLARRELLVGMGGVVGLAGCGDSNEDGSPRGLEDDAAIAEYLLRIAYVSRDLYDDALLRGVAPREHRGLLERLREQETRHVSVLETHTRRLAGGLPPQPQPGFDLKGEGRALSLATRLERLFASGYLGQAQGIRDGELREAALSILLAEGAHAATLAALSDRRRALAEGAFITPLSAVAVERRLDEETKR